MRMRSPARSSLSLMRVFTHSCNQPASMRMRLPARSPLSLIRVFTHSCNQASSTSPSSAIKRNQIPHTAIGCTHSAIRCYRSAHTRTWPAESEDPSWRREYASSMKRTPPAARLQACLHRAADEASQFPPPPTSIQGFDSLPSSSLPSPPSPHINSGLRLPTLTLPSSSLPPRVSKLRSLPPSLTSRRPNRPPAPPYSHPPFLHPFPSPPPPHPSLPLTSAVS